MVLIKTSNLGIDLLTIYAGRTGARFEVDDHAGGGCTGRVTEGTLKAAADVGSGMLMLG